MNLVLAHLSKLRIDLLMAFCLFGLMLFGSIFILSASVEQYETNDLVDTYFFRQVIFYFFGILIGFLFSHRRRRRVVLRVTTCTRAFHSQLGAALPRK